MKYYLNHMNHLSPKTIAGDFNCIEGENDKFRGNLVISSDLKDLHAIHHFVDIWRNHAKQKKFTWLNAAKTICSRLDKFIVSQDLTPFAGSCEIVPNVLSD